MYKSLFYLLIFIILFYVLFYKKESFVNFKSRKHAVINKNNSKYNHYLKYDNYDNYVHDNSNKALKENELLDSLLPKLHSHL